VNGWIAQAFIDGLLLPFQSVRAFMDAGGWVLWVILFAGVALWTLILERWWWFGWRWPGARQSWRQLWLARPERRSWTARRIRAAMLSEANMAMSSTLPLIQTLVAACPLLGLLGTVTGMIQVFDAMSLAGTGDAQAMAAGVSRATVPTMAGMIVGISGLLPLNRFQSRVKREGERLADALAYR
jgi:biopolymer transport protein ExbB